MERLTEQMKMLKSHGLLTLCKANSKRPGKREGVRLIVFLGKAAIETEGPSYLNPVEADFVCPDPHSSAPAFPSDVVL